MYAYSGTVVQQRLGKVEYWQQVLDDVDAVIWRPYTDCEAWATNHLEMPFVCRP